MPIYSNEKIYPISDVLKTEGGSSKRKCNPFLISYNFNLEKRKPFQWFLKRFLDITVCLIGSLVILPFLLGVMAAIKLESRGPLFFKQKRIGKYGKEFFMYKFRSMRQDAEEKLEELINKNETNSGMFKMSNDPRITKVGKFLRKYSIDELPQLINVIKGEMSLVGPRPPIRRELEDYNDWQYLRFSTLPGLTGIWQVSGRSLIKNFNVVVKMDYKYIRNWDFFLDISLLLRTIPVVLTAKGAS